MTGTIQCFIHVIVTNHKKTINMKIFLLFTIYIMISITVYPQDNILKTNRWNKWKTDTTVTQEGKINITKKRIKYTSNNCLITEEIILFHDECYNIIRKIKIRSDCRRNIGEGRILYEKKYRSKCAKNS